jgi:pimeloyl-ACP methyl ester carboxylesterase
MPRSFSSYDGLRLSYTRHGDGEPLICLAGGPGRDPAYLGDLGGGLDRELVFLQLRGTGDSAVPEDPASYRCDQMAQDVEALRTHLGLGQLDLLGHSAGGDLAMLYAARYPERVARLALVTPSLHAPGLGGTDEDLLASMEQRSAEPWFAGAKAAVLAAMAGDNSAATVLAYMPFFYGRWDEAARIHARGEAEQRHPAVAAGYYADGAYDPAEVTARLAKVTAPVLVLAGEIDLAPTPARATEAAALFPAGQLAVQPRAAHFPWLDDPALFRTTMTTFLTRP